MNESIDQLVRRVVCDGPNRRGTPKHPLDTVCNLVDHGYDRILEGEGAVEGKRGGEGGSGGGGAGWGGDEVDEDERGDEDAEGADGGLTAAAVELRRYLAEEGIIDPLTNPHPPDPSWFESEECAEYATLVAAATWSSDAAEPRRVLYMTTNLDLMVAAKHLQVRACARAPHRPTAPPLRHSTAPPLHRSATPSSHRTTPSRLGAYVHGGRAECMLDGPHVGP